MTGCDSIHLHGFGKNPLPSEDQLTMEGKRRNRWLAFDVCWHPNSSTFQLLIGRRVKTTTYLETQIVSYGDQSSVEERMEISPQGEAVADIVAPFIDVRLNVRRL